MDNDELLKTLALAKVAIQPNPEYAIIDAKNGYARRPTIEEITLSKALLKLWNEE